MSVVVLYFILRFALSAVVVSLNIGFILFFMLLIYLFWSTVLHFLYFLFIIQHYICSYVYVHVLPLKIVYILKIFRICSYFIFYFYLLDWEVIFRPSRWPFQFLTLFFILPHPVVKTCFGNFSLTFS